ncbi:glutathione S-transferase family protein [Chromobacterium sphagni]|uniref:Glutathione transferase n=1 Tax=Chromobacterium sphagni TaxID=1903179 RepID=A0A1S1X1U3_9NEIS|nr:glutathione S-transferase [Chromobacterium sphagni]OHX13507.1 glutathione transferase [Chromobacterium sphagni]OHX21963.1 glutathione transferase [Chromobacterium sphagni]
MIKLHGTPLSPYYNKVKVGLLEKGVNFQEVLTSPSQEDWLLEKSPMGKVPFVEINGHPVAESTVILEWLEDAYPTASLLPPTPNGRALARELMTMLELYVMAPSGPLVRHMVKGSRPEPAQCDEIRQGIARGISAVAQLAQQRPWLAGEDFSFADISAASILPLVAKLSQGFLGEDMTLRLSGCGEYLQRLGGRHSVARVWADRDASLAALMARRD